MLTLPQKLLDGIQRGTVKIAALVGIVIDFLNDEQSSQADWQAGAQLGTPGVDFPLTTFAANLTAGGTTATVVSTGGFTVGSNLNPGFLIFSDGTNLEIVSYTGSTNTTFTGLQRAKYGTPAVSWQIGEFVAQLLFSSGGTPEFDLEIQPKNWIQPVATGAPAARTGPEMVYRPTDNSLYMFGGFDGAVYLQDLWKFDLGTNTWTEIFPAANPAIRAFHHMVYNPQTDELWMAGGINGGGTLLDTWKYSFSAANWITNVAWNIPAARSSGMTTYYEDDAGTGLMFLAGGLDILAAPINTSLIFTGATWILVLQPAGFLWARGDACWMKKEGVIMVTAIASGFLASGTFDISLAIWNHAPQVTNPPATRYYPTLEYDDVNNLALLFGGAPFNVVGTSNYYAYNKQLNTWETLDDYSREGRTRHTAAWNSAAKELIVWGGAVNSSIPTFPAFPDPIRFRHYWDEVQFRTQTIDLGTTPTESGNWELEDITDVVNNLTAVAYSAEWSDDDITFNPIGSVLDGNKITDLHRYYRVTAVLTNLGLKQTPSVQRIDANFDDITWFSMVPNEKNIWQAVSDFPPIVSKISSLTSNIELSKFKASSGTLKFDLINTSKQAEKPISNFFPRGNSAYFKLGLFEKDFPITDFILVNKARVTNWTINKNTVHFDTEDFLGDFTKKEIPQETLAGAINAIVYNNVSGIQHPVDVIEDIIRNQINIPDRDLDLPSFDVVLNDPDLAGWAFNRTLSDPEGAWELIMDICYHIQSIIIPREDGKLSIKRIDPNDPAATEWDEKTFNFRNPKFNAKASTIRNYISTWWGWNGSGDGFADFKGAEVRTNVPSVDNWGQKVLRRKSRWLGNSSAPYQGDVRAGDISDRTLELLREGLPVITLETNMAAFETQVADIVRVRSSILNSQEEYMRWASVHNISRDLAFVDKTGRYSIPYRANGVVESIDHKWFVTKKRVDFNRGVITWELTRARQMPLDRTRTTQTDFQDGFGNSFDLESNPGAVEIALNGAVYFATATYEIIMDMDQTPERDGVISLDDTTPGDSSITYELWASETGIFMGEQMPIGSVVDTDPITLKTRFYKITATLNAQTDLLDTPALELIALTFTNG